MFHLNRVIAKQKTAMVIAVSLTSSELAELWGVVRNAQLIRVYFPGWTLRIYTKKQVAATADTKSIPASVISRLMALGADIVYIDTALTRVASKWWSYMVADDLSVDYALVRKPTSRLGEHDAMAIKDWIQLCEKSPLVAVHCIRATAYQGTRPMMHGLWAARPRVLRQLLGGRTLLSLIHQFINDSRSCGDNWEPSDFLSQVLWPLVQPNAVVCHDSVSRDVWPNSVELHHSQLGSVSQCVGAEYDAHEQLISGCDRSDQPLSNVLSGIDMLEFLV